MKRRSGAGGAASKARGRKATRLKRRKVAGEVARRSSSTAGAEVEVARLTRELNEALEQQTATSEVLNVVSRSTFDLPTVLNTLVKTAVRLCRADKAQLLLPSDNARSVYSAASFGYSPEYDEYLKTITFAPGREGVVGRVLLTRKPVQIADVLADPEYRLREVQQLGGFRTHLGLPLLREDSTIGVLLVSRVIVQPFDDKHIELLSTFAAQAVIAIENARLLNELREALEQQTATSEVLQVISSSPGDLQLVFASILENMVRVCDATFGAVYRCDGDTFKFVTMHNSPPAYAQLVTSSPFRPSPQHYFGRMIATKSVDQVADLAADQGYLERRPEFVAAVELGGVRTGLRVPMLKENDLIGALALARQEVRPFTDKQIELVQNFAAQAVIAIENARLLNELRDRTAQLEVQSQEVVKLNQHLEQRVADQVGEIERMGRLRRFLPPQVADLIVASGAEKQLESHRREITALFCDLRGFTGFTESADAEDVMALLRDYHATIGEIIIRYSGTLERYAGDGVMVVFNDPVPVDNPALRAVQMALETREAMGALTEKWRQLGHDLGFGIGIAHGFATLGTIGFEGRFDYAAIGTVSNVASRLCDEAKPGQILISPRVFMAVKDAVTVEPVGEFTLKGIRRPLAAHNVLAAKAAN